MLTLIKTDSPLTAAILKEVKVQAANLVDSLKEIDPRAEVTLEHDTFFVGIPGDQGRLVLGWGSTVKKAIEAAATAYQG